MTIKISMKQKGFNKSQKISSKFKKEFLLKVITDESSYDEERETQEIDGFGSYQEYTKHYQEEVDK